MNLETKNIDSDRFLAQNTEIEEINTSDGISDSNNVASLIKQDKIDNSVLNSRNDKNFSQCSSAGNIYSEDELNE
jgi:hypothetical protein